MHMDSIQNTGSEQDQKNNLTPAREHEIIYSESENKMEISDES